MRKRARWLIGAALASSTGCELVAGLSGDRELSLRASGGVSGSSGAAGHPGFGGRGSDGGAAGRSGAGGLRSGGAGTGAKPAETGGMGAEAGDGAGAGSTAGGAPGGEGGDSTGAGAPSSGLGGRGGGGAGAGAGGRGLGGHPATSALSCEEEAACTPDSACTTLPVPGGPFAMGRSETGTDRSEGGPNEQPEHEVTVSAFWLDKYEVTVGRFRRFVESYAGPPEAGQGAHFAVAGSGWKEEWNNLLPKDRDELEAELVTSSQCAQPYKTWTPKAGLGECVPINCIDWYLSYAFCIWDGGRLPTEAEWEYAAAGGEENRLYPWGPEDPDESRAVFGCPTPCSPSDIRRIGSTTEAGHGRFGQADLAGSMFERVRDAMDADFYSLMVASGTDVLNLAFDPRVSDGCARGGSYLADPTALRAAQRELVFRSSSHDAVGVRCARNP